MDKLIIYILNSNIS